jgi:hypothetical protein
LLAKNLHFFDNPRTERSGAGSFFRESVEKAKSRPEILRTAFVFLVF